MNDKKYIRITKPVGFQLFGPIFIVDKTQLNCFKSHGDKGRYVNDTLETEENLEKWLKYNNTSILKQANTIEELCDEAVFFDKDNVPHYKSKEGNVWYLGAGLFTKSLRFGIFTDKGLIYVAKMNDEGELELL